MNGKDNTVLSEPAELLGEDVHPLIQQLGPGADLGGGPSGVAWRTFGGVCDLGSLQEFLREYRVRVLESVELPAMVAAHGHAARGEARELVRLDQALAGDAVMREFAVASWRVGHRQLGKLRPLRDQRLVARYLAAVESGEARGWHTLVYGVSLAVFSLPLRQGLQHYVEQTTAGFIRRGAAVLRLPEDATSALIEEHTAGVAEMTAVAVRPVAGLQVC